MDGNSITILALIVVNIGAVAYSYGKLNQKVNDLCRRVSKVEKLMNKEANDER